MPVRPPDRPPPACCCCRALRLPRRLALLGRLETGRRGQLTARAVVVACLSFRTPQLLWASGVRPPALGHYLTEHPMFGATVVLSDATMARVAEISSVRRDAIDAPSTADPLAAVWVPYAGATHRYSGQINTSPGSPAGFAVRGLEGVAPERIVSLTWFCPKRPDFDDRIEFDAALDDDGLPRPEFHYRLNDEDRDVVAIAIKLTRKAGEAIGSFVPGEEPELLHYVAGNGLMPTATACNPTLTSAAFAVRAALHLAGHLLGK